MQEEGRELSEPSEIQSHGKGATSGNCSHRETQLLLEKQCQSRERMGENSDLFLSHSDFCPGTPIGQTPKEAS